MALCFLLDLYITRTCTDGYRDACECAHSHFNVSLTVRDKVTLKTVSTNRNLLGRETRAEAESSRGPSTYQPNALPLGSQKSAHKIYMYISCPPYHQLLPEEVLDVQVLQGDEEVVQAHNHDEGVASQTLPAVHKCQGLIVRQQPVGPVLSLVVSRRFWVWVWIWMASDIVVKDSPPPPPTHTHTQPSQRPTPSQFCLGVKWRQVFV